ncbi:hypothetical protein RB653_002491 [Dictyostelium firmibasis]|uniref:Calponin-homology (CH) domain-containing protein n=1 Tax=Dictyostelium firmibasis TaxID=79012 RepID=A0AAN7U984_9MYCE
MTYTDSRYNTLNRGSKKMDPPSITQEVLASAKISKKDNVLINANAEDGSVHTFSEEEKVAYSKFITERLLDQEDVLSNYIPIDPSTEQLFVNCTDGVLLNKLMESLFSTQVNLKGLCIKNKMNPFEMIQNQNIVIKNAIEVGCIIVNIGAQDLMNATPYLVLGVIWQIIKQGLLSKVNQNANEILEILFEEDSVKEVDNTQTNQQSDEHSAEEILLRWVNYHLEKEGCERRISNFSEDIQDSVVYSHLFHQLVPIEFENLVSTIHSESNLFSRAELITKACEKIGVKCFLTPSDIALGHPKLNLALVASLFNSEAAIANLRREREEKHRSEQDRLERERLERERLERERLERERLEQERLEQERLERERLERQRQEMERIEQERLERERLERERQEQERLEQERLERERLERERLEQERLEQERLERERLEHERLERERLEREEMERLERERLEQEEMERIERERLEYEERERIERERIEREREELEEQERLEYERLEQERIEREEIERIERERIEHEEFERLEEERIERERLEAERLEAERVERELRERERVTRQGELERIEYNKEYKICIRIQKRMIDDTSLTDNMTKLIGDITELKRNIIGELRNTTHHQAELKKLTKSIDRVLENKNEGKKLKKQKKVIIKPVKGVPNGLDPNKMKNYQSLFYYLQTRPEVMGKLLFLLDRNQMGKTFDNLLLSMFPYEISPREEDLFLKALTVGIEYQIKYSETLQDFLQSESVPMKLLYQYFKKKGFKYLKEIITPMILKVLDQTDLNLNFDPHWIQKEIQIAKELKDGRKSEKKTSDQTFEQLMQNNDVVSIFNSRCLQLVELGNTFLERIVKSMEQLPVQLRYLCRIIAEKSKYAFPTNQSNNGGGISSDEGGSTANVTFNNRSKLLPENREKYVSYFLIIYRFIVPIISSPDLLNELVLLQHPYITKQSRFNLSQLSRLIQSVFSEKPWMNSFPTVYLNKWIIQNSPSANKFLCQVSQVPDLDELIHYTEYNEIMLENNIKFCSVINISEIIWLHETILSNFYDLEDIGTLNDVSEKSIQNLAERAINSKLDKGKYVTAARQSTPAIMISQKSHNWALKKYLDEIDFPIQLPEQGDRSIQLSFINRLDQLNEQAIDLWKECKLWMIDILSKSQAPRKDTNTIEIIRDATNYFKTGNNSSENLSLINKSNDLISRLRTFDRDQCTDGLDGGGPDNYNLFLLDVEKELTTILRKNKVMRSELTRLHSLLKSIRIDAAPLEHLVKFQNEQLEKAIVKKQLKTTQLTPIPKDKSTIKPHKFILLDLVKKGMILRCELPESSYSKTKIHIKSLGPGLFEIEAKFGPITKSLQLELDDLLEKSKNHIDEFPLEGITLDVTLTIHLLMKLFSL